MDCNISPPREAIAIFSLVTIHIIDIWTKSITNKFYKSEHSIAAERE